MDRFSASSDDSNRATVRAIETFLELIVMNPRKNVVPRLTVTLKKAILSMALDRYNFNREIVCKVLGLSSSQFDEEMRLSGLALVESMDRS